MVVFCCVHKNHRSETVETHECKVGKFQPAQPMNWVATSALWRRAMSRKNMRNTKITCALSLIKSHIMTFFFDPRDDVVSILSPNTQHRYNKGDDDGIAAQEKIIIATWVLMAQQAIKKKSYFSLFIPSKHNLNKN